MSLAASVVICSQAFLRTFNKGDWDMAAKKAPAKQTVAQKNAKVLALATSLLRQVRKHHFDAMCEKGRAEVIEAAELLGVDPSVFAGTRWVKVTISEFSNDFPARYNGRCLTNKDDWDIKITMVHRPTGETFEAGNEMLEAVEEDFDAE